MPTGYTHGIEKGISFNEFVMGCARGRDDSSDAPIPDEFKPSTYRADALKEFNEELVRLSKMSLKEAEIQADKDYKKSICQNKKIVDDKKLLEKKYNAMLDKVKAWIPPTPEHRCFKQFMIDQIQDSIGFDCDTSYYVRNPSVKQSAKEWLVERIESCKHDIEYHTKENAEEIACCKKRSDWIKALKNSLAKE